MLSHTVTPKVWRYLGFFLMSTLDWKPHTTQVTNKAKSYAAALRMMANCVRGFTIVDARTLFLTVLLPILTYSCTIWFNGAQQNGIVNILHVAQNACVRWVMGAFRTSPVEELHHIACIPPIRYTLVKQLENACIRLNCLKRSHPLNVQMSTAENITNLTRMATWVSQIVEHVVPGLRLPWHINACIQCTTDESDRTHAINVGTRSDTTVIVYTDGSGMKAHWLIIVDRYRRFQQTIDITQKRFGAGVVAYIGGKKIAEKHWPGGAQATVYDMEMLALAGGMRTAVDIAKENKNISRIVLASDNTSAVGSISDLSHHAAQQFSVMFRKYADFFTETDRHTVEIVWVRGHGTSVGNKVADRLAKEATGILHNILGGPTISWARGCAKQCLVKQWQHSWAN
jgi:ribonuclease HI